MRKPTIFAGIGVFAAAVIAVAQTGQPQGDKPSQPPKTGVMKMKCDIGSFLVKGSGKITINFRGTLLVYRLKGTVNISGNVRKEFEGFDRVSYFGTGTAVIQGEWRHIQWFGGDMTAVWNGQGYAHTF
ncbi:MAG: hypothetical protein C4342_06180, partial [Armatimonadota bacterium]